MAVAGRVEVHAAGPLVRDDLVQQKGSGWVSGRCQIYRRLAWILRSASLQHAAAICALAGLLNKPGSRTLSWMGLSDLLPQPLGSS